jgi:hypothetical protein
MENCLGISGPKSQPAHAISERDRGIRGPVRIQQVLGSHLPQGEGPALLACTEFAGSEPAFDDLVEGLHPCFSFWSVSYQFAC